jgi:hypothetical protein
MKKKQNKTVEKFVQHDWKPGSETLKPGLDLVGKI